MFAKNLACQVPARNAIIVWNVWLPTHDSYAQHSYTCLGKLMFLEKYTLSIAHLEQIPEDRVRNYMTTTIADDMVSSILNISFVVNFAFPASNEIQFHYSCTQVLFSQWTGKLDSLASIKCCELAYKKVYVLLHCFFNYLCTSNNCLFHFQNRNNESM